MLNQQMEDLILGFSKFITSRERELQNDHIWINLSSNLRSYI